MYVGGRVCWKYVGLQVCMYVCMYVCMSAKGACMHICMYCTSVYVQRRKFCRPCLSEAAACPFVPCPLVPQALRLVEGRPSFEAKSTGKMPPEGVILHSLGPAVVVLAECVRIWLVGFRHHSILVCSETVDETQSCVNILAVNSQSSLIAQRSRMGSLQCRSPTLNPESFAEFGVGIQTKP